MAEANANGFDRFNEALRNLDDQLQELRAQHFKARHVAWAFVIGARGKLALRYSDDGEPSGTIQEAVS